MIYGDLESQVSDFETTSVETSFAYGAILGLDVPTPRGRSG
jgi:hypothetical protein